MICDRDAIKSVDSLPIHDRIWKNRVTSADCTILVDFCAKHLNVRSAESVCYKSLVKCDARTCRKLKDANLYSLWNLSTHTHDKLNKYRNCIHFFFFVQGEVLASSRTPIGARVLSESKLERGRNESSWFCIGALMKKRQVWNIQLLTYKIKDACNLCYMYLILNFMHFNYTNASKKLHQPTYISNFCLLFWEQIKRYHHRYIIFKISIAFFHLILSITFLCEDSQIN